MGSTIKFATPIKNCLPIIMMHLQFLPWRAVCCIPGWSSRPKTHRARAHLWAFSYVGAQFFLAWWPFVKLLPTFPLLKRHAFPGCSAAFWCHPSVFLGDHQQETVPCRPRLAFSALACMGQEQGVRRRSENQAFSGIPALFAIAQHRLGLPASLFASLSFFSSCSCWLP